jgi:GTP-binding protein EngB required for normal cell division
MSKIASLTMVAIYCLFGLSLSVKDVDESKGVRYLLIGNPGTGKSTILNGLAGKALFNSGPSFGAGKTKQLQKETVGNNVFMDTPGLADISLREQAAKAITAALKEGGAFKIIFVMTLEAGRVQAADRSTMQVVLQSAPITQYGVMVNKLEQNVYDALLENKDQARDFVVQGLMDGLAQPSLYFHFMLRNEDLAGKKDKAVPLDEDLVRFIQNVPAIEIDPQKVEAIKTNEFDAMTAEFENQIAAMQSDIDLLEKAKEESANKYDQLVKEMALRNKKLQREYDAAQKAQGQPSPSKGLGLGGVLGAVRPTMSEPMKVVMAISKAVDMVKGVVDYVKGMVGEL